MQACDSCRFGRSLVLSPIVTSPCLLTERKKQGVSQSCRLDVGPGDTALLARACVPPDACQAQRTSGHGDPLVGRLDTAPLELDDRSRGLVTFHGDCERLPRLPSTAKGQERLQRSGSPRPSTRGIKRPPQAARVQMNEPPDRMPRSATQHRTTAPTSMRKHSRSLWETKRRNPRLTTVQKASV